MLRLPGDMSIRHIYRILKTMSVGVVWGLPMAQQGRDPLDIFEDWFKNADKCGLFLAEAVALATSTPAGQPSARMVLLKGFDQRGFVFFTNYGSRKSGELDANPNAALLFHWGILQRQIRIEGTVERIPTAESAAYFNTRPRASRIAAWASRQSEVLQNREELERRYKTKLAKFAQGEVPLPDFWGGYRLQPAAIEFWQGRANRMHDRLRFRRSDGGWVGEWLYP